MNRIWKRCNEMKKSIWRKIDNVTGEKNDSQTKDMKSTPGEQKFEDTELQNSAQASTSSQNKLQLFSRQKVPKYKNPEDRAEKSNTKILTAEWTYVERKVLDRKVSITSETTDITSISQESN